MLLLLQQLHGLALLAHHRLLRGHAVGDRQLLLYAVQERQAGVELLLQLGNIMIIAPVVLMAVTTVTIILILSLILLSSLSFVLLLLYHYYY